MAEETIIQRGSGQAYTSNRRNGPSAAQLMTQLDMILSKLQQNFEGPYRILQRRIEVNKAIVDSLNALIPVSAFIAGVQSQVIASTSLSNSTPVSVTANWFAFNGLVLDILGTAFGALRAISLQRSTRGAERNLQSMSMNYEHLRRTVISVKEQLQTGADPASCVGALETMHTYQSEQKQLLETLESLYTISFPSLLDFSPVNIIPAHGMLARFLDRSPRVKRVFRSIGFFLESVEELFVTPVRHPRSTIPDQVPMLVMGLGIIFLLISVILLAVSTQLRRVWLGCIIVSGLVCVYAAPGIMVTDDGHSGHKGRVLSHHIELLSQKILHDGNKLKQNLDADGR